MDKVILKDLGRKGSLIYSENVFIYNKENLCVSVNDVVVVKKVFVIRGVSNIRKFVKFLIFCCSSLLFLRFCFGVFYYVFLRDLNMSILVISLDFV